MLPEVLFSLSVVVLVIAILFFILARRGRNRQRLMAIELERRRQVMQAELDDEVVWSRQPSADEPAARNLSRRRLVPNIMAGCAALLLFRLEARGTSASTAADRIRGTRQPLPAHAGESAFDHTDNSSHSDVHFDHDDAAAPHQDTHSDFNRHSDHSAETGT